MTKKVAKFAKRDIAQEITDEIIASLEEGVAPWVRPWNTVGEGVPVNPVSKTRYRGINMVWLMMASNGFSTNRWVTPKQAQGVNAKIRKGSTGMPVVFWKQLEVADRDAEPKADGKQPTKRIPFMKHYTVFNLDQLEPIGDLSEADTVDKLYPEPLSTDNLAFEPHQYTDDVIEATAAKVQKNMSGACYIPSLDVIQMPAAEKFKSNEDYYATKLHELTHWTGHKSRLDRLTGDKFGGKGYAFEELVAELGAAMLCCECGIEGQLQHASYIQSWLKVLKEDKKAILKAGSLAQQAMDHILSYSEADDHAATA